MAAQKTPKVVLFDIGGVCVCQLLPHTYLDLRDFVTIRLIFLQVLSPMQGILDFENQNGVPNDWINHAIRHSSPNGHWQRLERGEIKLDAEFFKGFTADLNNEAAWQHFHTGFRNEKRKLKDVANPTQLGDHVSLKAEAADSKPTDGDRGAQSDSSAKETFTSSNGNQYGEKPSLSKLAMDPTIGDPTSLEAEDVVESSNKSDSKGATPFKGSTTSSSFPPTPQVDGEAVFWKMMGASREVDPYVFPAVERLSRLKTRPIMGALSNTVIFPADHPWRRQKSSSASGTETSNAFLLTPKDFFDVYISSAEVGMRKPSRNIYELAMKRLNEFDKQRGGSGVRAEDVVFLDDIGENLKMGKEVGMKTIKVQLGKTWRAIKELEGVLGLELMDDVTRRSKL